MSNDHTILIVDDAQDNRLLLSMLLEEKYTVIEVESGRACLDYVLENLPDLILLDVNMPGLTGYEVCVNLRKNKKTEGIPVIFVSALDSAEERLAGFEAGADDYITKPVDGEELLKKVEFRLQRVQEIVKAKSDASAAINVAMEAMTSSSELGQIIQFVKNVQQIDSKYEVGQAIIDIASSFSLKASALVVDSPPIVVGCAEDSIEAKLLSRFLDSPERVTNRGIRTVIRSENMALLVKNMPLDDDTRYGRLKDHLAVLEDIANGRLQTLNARDLIEKQKSKLLKKVVELAEKQIKLTSKKIHEHSEMVNKSMEQMLDELESMLFSLGLDDDQERKLIQLADRTSIKLNESNEDTKKLDSELGVILEALYDLLEKGN
ncbi:response regulator [Aliikangiella sp. IMCC44359]|uniref:response regulator n=1 Tax=Aliikangiella sp. IMCC44359 TaxID=3459125 RepID=UPI00403AD46D